ncbi:MAG: PQQ-binding-like beta-propeller repeat protein [Deltaproteobacteria bacterium]|nr:PQQ-binding-like beta-propeller repeat protein [Deltaproteobacteria bacterium]
MRIFVTLVLLGLVACSGKKGEEPKRDQPIASAVDAEGTFKRACGQCHVPREQAAKTPAQEVKLDPKLPPDIQAFMKKRLSQPAPDLETLRTYSAAAIVLALERGTMSQVGAELSAAERVAVAEYLSGKKYDSTMVVGNYCGPNVSQGEKLDGPRWYGASNGPANDRFQRGAGLTRENVSKLKLKWAYALPEGRQGSTLETLGSRLFIGDTSGRVHSIDRSTGCVYWIYSGDRWVRSAFNVTKLGDHYVAAFGTAALPYVFTALDALTGKTLWKQTISTDKQAHSSSSPVMYDGTLYVPISVGYEQRQSQSPKHECCTGRGAVIALDPTNGAAKWTSYMTPEPQKLGKNVADVQMWGPSGGSVWKVPTIDPALKRIYVGTGENITGPQTETGGAIVAIDMADGKIAWSKRLADDVIFNGSCYTPWVTGHCAEKPPVSADATSPVLVELPDKKRVLVGANKNSRVVGLDPDNNGAVLWDKTISPGGGFGGVHWGMATDGEKVYIPYADRFQWPKLTTKQWKDRLAKKQPHYQDEHLDAGGLVALRASDGAEVWRVHGGKESCAGKAKECAKAFASPPTVIPGVVFATSQDGFVRAYNTDDGALLWEFDTAREFDAIQGGKASGGGIDGPGGVIVVDGMLYLTSGYTGASVMPGNVLLAFAIDGR